jgi:23S rRNA pseudouridine1911/1915/1917 synthase
MAEDNVLRFKVPAELVGERADKAVASLARGQLTRTRIRKLMEDGNLLVDGGEVKPSSKVEKGQEIEIFLPPPEPAELLPQDIPLDIPYEDEYLIVVNKPSGMVVHPAAGNPDGTLVNALLHRCSSLEGGELMRPGIVHRLDKDTSGLMVVAKDENTHARLAAMFSSKSVVRQYEALVFGIPPAEGVIDTPYGRSRRNRKKFTGEPGGLRRAVTRYRNLRRFERAGVSLVGLVLETGRTHQIRVHMSESGWPLVGDPLYGRKRVPKGLGGVLGDVDRTLLHSVRIEFAHPRTGSWIRIEAGRQRDFEDVVRRLEEMER